MARADRLGGHCAHRADGSFFSDNRFEEEPRRSRLHLVVGGRAEEAKGVMLGTDVRYRVALPRTEKRLQLFLNQVFEFEEPADPEALREAFRKPDPDVGLQLLIPFRASVSSSVGAGARFGNPL